MQKVELYCLSRSLCAHHQLASTSLADALSSVKMELLMYLVLEEIYFIRSII